MSTNTLEHSVDTLSFANGDTMPMLGLGTWKSAPGEVYDAVKTALQAGYRHVDCAPIYGNEAEVGRALQESFDDGVVDRDDVWVTSKLWNDSHAPEDVRPALEATLDDLNLDVLDLYLIHWPVAHKKGVEMPQSPDELLSLDERPIRETWAAMQELVDAGLVRHIGVSNFSVPKLRSLIDAADHPPEMNQIELHPYLQQSEMLDFCDEAGVHLTAYSPLGSSDRPEAMKIENEPSLMSDPTVHDIADRYDASPAQVLISWALHRGTVVIPKSVTPAHIKDNLAAAELALTDADMDALAELDRGFRYVNGAGWTMEGSPYTLANIWDE
jgi:alcohol dehydrogenase (NADP+)